MRLSCKAQPPFLPLHPPTSRNAPTPIFCTHQRTIVLRWYGKRQKYRSLGCIFRCQSVYGKRTKRKKARKHGLFGHKIRTLTSILTVSKLAFLYGPSDRVRTCGLMVPNHPRYQLRYTRIFTFSVSENFTVCGQSCGQMQFRGAFQWTAKPRKRLCVKGFRRFCFTRLGCRHGTPKPSAVPAPLHPDICYSIGFHLFALKSAT